MDFNSKRKESENTENHRYLCEELYENKRRILGLIYHRDKLLSYSVILCNDQESRTKNTMKMLSLNKIMAKRHNGIVDVDLKPLGATYC